MEYTVVLVTASDCKACTSVKREIVDYDSMIRNKGLDFVNVETPSLKRPPTDNRLKRYVKWFPTFILYNADDWISKNRIPTPLSVFNGYLDTRVGVFVLNDQQLPTTISTISDWIDSNTNTRTTSRDNRNSLEDICTTVNIVPRRYY